MTRRGWEIAINSIRTDTGNRINLRGLGPIKNGVSVTTALISVLGAPDFLSRWLFNYTTLGVRNRIINIPVFILPMTNTMAKMRTRAGSGSASFEHTQNQLEMLSPLSHNYPFVILGYSDEFKELEVIELEQDPLVEKNKVIDRCIEFPAEYHQAGLNILNFFGTYLREQYPNENAKVKIEQHGLVVRLIIESNDGKSEVIEKALHEYQLIISGAQPPEALVANQNLVLELKNELRIAKFRIESQQDIISIQNSRIDNLFKIVEVGLANKNVINIDFKPIISTNSGITINQNISNALNDIGELKNLIPSSSDAYIVLKELEGSMEAVEKETNPEVVKTSPAMQKLKKFIEIASDANTDIGKAIKVAESGWDTFKTLAGNYNKIAQWCGLPQVPTVFTK